MITTVNPQRTCIGCRNKVDKKNLLRIVKTPNGDVKVDLTGNMDGRGAYICKNEKCVEIAIKKNAFSRALKCEVSEETIKSVLMR